MKFWNMYLMISSLLFMISCTSPMKQFVLEGVVIDSLSREKVPNYVINIWAINKPSISDAMISKQVKVKETITDNSGNFRIEVEASWKIRVETSDGSFCRYGEDNERYIIVKSISDETFLTLVCPIK